MAAHFCQFGGLPLLAVFDRPGTIVTNSDPKTGVVLARNATFAELTSRLGVTVEVCWPDLRIKRLHRELQYAGCKTSSSTERSLARGKEAPSPR